MSAPMTAAEYAAELAAEAGPLTEGQVEAAARILASVTPAASSTAGLATDLKAS